MEYIEKNEKLISSLIGEYSLTSATINRLEIYKDDDKLTVTVYLTLSISKKKLLLKFINVEEFSFYHQANYFFYNIEIIKFFLIKGNCYISFDPTDESSEISSNDQDYILCRDVEGYLV